MIIQPVEIELGFPGNERPRTPGVHVSKIIKSLALQKGKLDPKWASGEVGLVEVGDSGQQFWDSLDPPSKLRMSMGMAWEEWYIPQLGDVVKHPGELFLDNVYMTHDGESLDIVSHEGTEQYAVAVHEIKLTYKSTNTVGDLRREWMWITQTQCYCKALKTNIAYVHALFVCGDYARPIQPQLKCWRVQYDQSELDKTWEEIIGHMRMRLITEGV